MKRGTPDHPKARRLARLLSVEPWGAVGILESLWHWTARFAPAGDVGRFGDDDIAQGIGWSTDPSVLVRALVDSGWIDESETHRLVIHDWHEHADEAVHMALARAGKLFASGEMPRLGKLPKEERERVAALFAQASVRTAAPFVRTASARQAHGKPRSAHNIPSTPPEPRQSPAPPEPCVGAAADAASPPKPRRASSGKTRAPEDLTPEAKSALLAWVRAKEPDAEPEIRALVDACLDHFRASGALKADWLATCRTWIRNRRRYGPRGEPKTFGQMKAEGTRRAITGAVQLLRGGAA